MRKWEVLEGGGHPYYVMSGFIIKYRHWYVMSLKYLSKVR